MQEVLKILLVQYELQEFGDTIIKRQSASKITNMILIFNIL